MRTSTSARALAVIVCAVGLGACRPKIKAETVGKDIPPPSGDTTFTPPEIRRPAPNPSDSAAALVVPATDSHPRPKTVPNSAPPPQIPAVSAKPAPAVPTPAASKVAPAVEPTPAAVVSHSPSGGAEPGQEGDWVLQVNIHKTEASARAQVDKLASEGIPAYALPVSTEGAGLAGQYWRVRVGRFTTRAAAQAYGQEKIVPRGLKFWVDRKSNERRAEGTP